MVRTMGKLGQRRATWLIAMGAMLTLGAGVGGANAETIFHGADLALGQKLIAEHKCSSCHARRVGGDGNDIYKQPGSKVANAALLRGMVEYCNTELGLGMFPEEVTAVSAVLNRDFYKYRE